jgi:apolipoprotein N-acyltransferase
LFVAWRDRGPAATAGYAWLAGAVYYGIVCSWIWYFGAVAIIPFVIGLGAYWALAGLVIGWFRSQGVASPWLTAALWVLADAFVARAPFGGLSWGEVGYAFHDVVPARALASVGGLALVSYGCVALNSLVADLLVDRSRRAVVQSYIGVGLIAVAAVAATVTRPEPHSQSSIRVALVQGNDLNRDLTLEEERDRYLPNSHFALADTINRPVDLIVFPESSMDDDPRTDPFLRNRIGAIAREHDAFVLANATVDAPAHGDIEAGEEAQNLNVLFGPDGEVRGEYAKQHLVPFGERVPFRDLLEELVTSIDTQVPRDMRPGASREVFDVGGVRAGMLICFESAFGYEVRALVRDGAEALVVSTNNRSYRRSANSEQHLAIGQMRVAETGRPLIQAAISGITAVIDADGNISHRTKLFENGVVETTVTGATGETLYVRYGEWVAAGSIVVVLAALVVVVIRRRRRRSVESQAAQETISIESRIAGYDLPGTEAGVAVSPAKD